MSLYGALQISTGMGTGTGDILQLLYIEVSIIYNYTGDPRTEVSV